MAPGQVLSMLAFSLHTTWFRLGQLVAVERTFLYENTMLSLRAATFLLTTHFAHARHFALLALQHHACGGISASRLIPASLHAPQTPCLVPTPSPSPPRFCATAAQIFPATAWPATCSLFNVPGSRFHLFPATSPWFPLWKKYAAFAATILRPPASRRVTPAL